MLRSRRIAQSSLALAIAVVSVFAVPKTMGAFTAASSDCGTPISISVPEGNATAATIQVTEPPSGFDPASASNAELGCFHLPLRPSGGPALALWAQIITGFRNFVPPSGFGQVDQAAAPVSQLPSDVAPAVVGATHYTTYNPPADYPWAGYAAPKSLNGWTNLQWTQAWADYNAPTGHTYCTAAQIESWVGIGGDGWDGGSANLIQDGAIVQNYNPLNTKFFWENFFPGNNTVHTFATPSVSPGDPIYTEVYYYGSNTTAFTYDNYRSGSYTAFTQPTPNIDLTAADFIVEGYPHPDYVNSAAVPFSLSEASGTWGSGYSITKFLDQTTVSKFIAENGNGQVVEQPGPLSSNGTFTDSSTSNAKC